MADNWLSQKIGEVGDAAWSGIKDLAAKGTSYGTQPARPAGIDIASMAQGDADKAAAAKKLAAKKKPLVPSMSTRMGQALEDTN